VAYHLFWDPTVFLKIVTYFSVWHRALFLALYLAAGAVLIFCKKTYKQGKDHVD
jgi:hypothetical protein